MPGTKIGGGLLREIDSLRRRDRVGTVEASADHALTAVERFLESVRENLPEESRADIIKRFFNAARTGDRRKVYRGIERIRRDADTT